MFHLVVLYATGAPVDQQQLMSSSCFFLVLDPILSRDKRAFFSMKIVFAAIVGRQGRRDVRPTAKACISRRMKRDVNLLAGLDHASQTLASRDNTATQNRVYLKKI